MRLDAHQHVWRYSAATHPWIGDSMSVLRRDYLPQDLRPLLDAAGFDGSIAVQAALDVAETRWLLALADENPWIRGVVGWVDLTRPDCARELEVLARHPKLKGIRHVAQDEPDPRFLLRKDFARGIAELRRFGLAYDLLVYPRQLPAAIELVDRFPAQPFVLDHLGKPEIRDRGREPWAGLVRELARRENVCCKLSGLVTEADWRRWSPTDLAFYLDVALESFGPERLMIGSDWPVCLLAGDYAAVMGVVLARVASLASAEREAILGGTAARFYRISD